MAHIKRRLESLSVDAVLPYDDGAEETAASAAVIDTVRALPGCAAYRLSDGAAGNCACLPAL